MQPHKKKVLIMVAVSLGIIVFSFMIPIVIIPAYLGVSGAGNCALSSGCAGSTFDKCGAYQSSGESTTLLDSLDRGMKGMLCMMGLDGGSAKAIMWSEWSTVPITLNKIPSL